MNQPDNVQLPAEGVKFELKNVRTLSKGSLDDSAQNINPHENGAQENGGHSPHRVISFVHKTQDEKMNFKKWILSLVSIGNMIMSPMIVIMGFQARSYGVSKVEADNALIIMGIFTFLLSLATLIATIMLKKRVLFFILYAFLIMLVFFSIFTFGLFSFQPDIKQWVYENWGHLRFVTDKFSYEQFEKDVKNDLLSLGVFSITIIVGTIICIIAIIQLLGTHVIQKRILPFLSLLTVVFSSAMIIIAIHARKNASYADLPTWVDGITIGIGLFLMAIGVFGYYASFRQSKKLLIIYLAALVPTLCFMLYAAFGYLAMSSTIEELVDKDWPKIYNNLVSLGYNVTKGTFMSYVMMNIKFAGLYGLMYSCVVLLAIVCTIIKIKMLSHNH